MLRTPACHRCDGHAHAHRQGCPYWKPDQAATLTRLVAEDNHKQKERETQVSRKHLLATLDHATEALKAQAGEAGVLGLQQAIERVRQKVDEIYPEPEEWNHEDPDGTEDAGQDHAVRGSRGR